MRGSAFEKGGFRRFSEHPSEKAVFGRFRIGSPLEKAGFERFLEIPLRRWILREQVGRCCFDSYEKEVQN